MPDTVQSPAAFTAERIDVYTFGSPRVGNAAFVDFYDRHVPNTWRHVNDEDIVPLVPPTWAGYRHVGTVRQAPIAHVL